MRFSCCVSSCTNVYTKACSLAFFRIPKNKSVEWIKQIGRPELADGTHNNARICAVHFEALYFKNKEQNRLTADAIPTLHLEMDYSKRKRTSNFTLKEEEILVSLVQKYASVIECKKKDPVTNAMKIAAWVKLADEYNCVCPEQYRDHIILKKKYENWKKNAKKVATEKMDIFGTGGEPSMKSEISTCDEAVISIIREKQAKGLTAVYDDNIDVPPLVSTTGCLSVENECNESTEMKKTEASPSTSSVIRNIKINFCQDWSNYTPSMLKTPTSPPLLVSQHPANIRNNKDKENKIKGKLTKTMTSYISRKETEAEQRINCMIKQHLQEMKHKDELHKQKMEHNEEIHKLQKELLLKQINKE